MIVDGFLFRSNRRPTGKIWSKPCRAVHRTYRRSTLWKFPSTARPKILLKERKIEVHDRIAVVREVVSCVFVVVEVVSKMSNKTCLLRCIVEPTENSLTEGQTRISWLLVDGSFAHHFLMGLGSEQPIGPTFRWHGIQGMPSANSCRYAQ